MAKRKKKEKPLFDFEAIYQRYPRKEGKTRGMMALATSIKTAEEYQLLSQAVDNYAALCRRDGREERYIKHWGTFVTSWRDYVEAPPAPPTPPASGVVIDQLQRIMEGKL